MAILKWLKIDFFSHSVLPLIRFRAKKIVMTLKMKVWLVSQGLLVLTACIIQLTFYREIQYGPFRGMPKRPYWEIIKGVDPVAPEAIRSLKPELYDARLPMSEGEAKSRGLAAYRLAARQEDGLRFAFVGGFVVNGIYFVVFHVLFSYFTHALRSAEKKRQS